MTYDQIISFFPNFISSVYKHKKLTIKNKWAIKPKIPGNEIVEPTPPCPGWNPELINPKTFFGLGKVFLPGNLTSKLCLQVVHILLKLEYNPDQFAN